MINQKKLEYHRDPRGPSIAELRNFPVNYQWSGSDGTICRSHTVAAGRNRRDAEDNFFRQNKHVVPPQRHRGTEEEL